MFLPSAECGPAMWVYLPCLMSSARTGAVGSARTCSSAGAWRTRRESSPSLRGGGGTVRLRQLSLSSVCQSGLCCRGAGERSDGCELVRMIAEDEQVVPSGLSSASPRDAAGRAAAVERPWPCLLCFSADVSACARAASVGVDGLPVCRRGESGLTSLPCRLRAAWTARPSRGGFR